VIRSLRVVHTHENPWQRDEWLKSKFDFEIAQNLEELSVFGHEGGGRLWRHFISKNYLPKLRRLGFAEVTNYGGGTTEQEDYAMANGSENPVMDAITWDEMFLNSRVPFKQLEVVVTDWQDVFVKIPNFPFDRFLVMLNSPQPLSKDLLQNCTAYMFPKWRLHLGNEVDLWLKRTLRLLAEEGRSTRFISLPPLGVCGSGKTEDIKELQTIVEEMRNKGIEVALEKNCEKMETLILPSFVNHLKRTGKLSR